MGNKNSVPITAVDQLADEYDYVVVGSGSAGAVVAARLSEDKKVSVLVLEAGDDDLATDVKLPAAAPKLQSTERDWAYRTEPQKQSHGAMVDCVSNWPRGKCLGGSSSINYMMYCRGVAEDYDRWAKDLGCNGWGYEECLPYFKKSECNMMKHLQDSDIHGTTGPMAVSNLVSPNKASVNFVKACVDVGLEKIDDYNCGSNLGVSLLQVTQRGGERCGTGSASFLKAAAKGTNLTVCTMAHVMKVAFDSDKNATGVVIANAKGGDDRVVKARKEVVVCAGAVNSPQLLLLSGVGPKADLEALEIPVVADSPGVGKNLQDHLICSMTYEICGVEMLSESSANVTNIAQYLLQKKGPLTSSGLEATVFHKTGERPDLGNAPDLQIHQVATGGTALDVKNLNLQPDNVPWTVPENGILLLSTLLHPKSKGTVTLRTNKHSDHPIIDPNYLSDESDVRTMVNGIRLIQKIATSETWKPFTAHKGDGKLACLTKLGMNDNPHQEGSDEYLGHYTRQAASTVYHPVGTCKMGPDTDDMAVVTPRLLVRGVQRLRVVDASVMPDLPSGNTNAPAVMVGERGADFIKADHAEAA